MARMPDYLKLKINKPNDFTITVDDFPDYGKLKVKMTYKLSWKFKVKVWIVTKLLIIVSWVMHVQLEWEVDNS
jgi:hypothetical protein